MVLGKNLANLKTMYWLVILCISSFSSYASSKYQSECSLKVIKSGR